MEKALNGRLTNSGFMKTICNSFEAFINSGTSRSTKKLKPLHGAIAADIANRLGDDYTIISQGFADDKEALVPGRYFDKKADITIKKDGKVLGAIAVKFVMQNYAQNSNNYFENMLGETANVRSGKCAYFQILIILDRMPYYKRDAKNSIVRWEHVSDHNLHKYVQLSQDNTDIFFHTPNKTLIEVVHIPDNDNITNKQEYVDYYSSIDLDVTLSDQDYPNFDSAVVLNDYEAFMDKVYHTIKSI